LQRPWPTHHDELAVKPLHIITKEVDSVDHRPIL
jgi:hypothetical protein